MSGTGRSGGEEGTEIRRESRKGFILGEKENPGTLRSSGGRSSISSGAIPDGESNPFGLVGSYPLRRIDPSRI